MFFKTEKLTKTSWRKGYCGFVGDSFYKEYSTVGFIVR